MSEWTKQAPKQAGWYGYRDDYGSDFIWFDGTMYTDATGKLVEDYLVADGEWMGPLEPRK